MIMNYDISWYIMVLCDLYFIGLHWSLYFVVTLGECRSQVSTSIAASFLHPVDCVTLHWQHRVPTCARCNRIAIASCQRETVRTQLYLLWTCLNKSKQLRVGFDVPQMDGQSRSLANPFLHVLSERNQQTDEETREKLPVLSASLASANLGLSWLRL